MKKPCEHDAGELVGMLHAHVSAAQKNLVMWCLGDKHMLHRCVFFFNIERGRQCVMDKFIDLHHKYGLLSSSLPLMWYVPNSWQSLKEKNGKAL